MGEIAEMMLEGILCEVCGEFLGDAAGFPQRCFACGGDAWIDDHLGDARPASFDGPLDDHPHVIAARALARHAISPGEVRKLADAYLNTLKPERRAQLRAAFPRTRR